MFFIPFSIVQKKQWTYLVSLVSLVAIDEYINYYFTNFIIGSDKVKISPQMCLFWPLADIGWERI